MDQPTPTHAIVPIDLARAIQTYLGRRLADETAEMLVALKICQLANLAPQAPLPQDVAGNDDEPPSIAT